MTHEPRPFTFAEYERRRIPAGRPTDADLRLTDRLLSRDSDPRITVRWLANGEVDVETSSWVGVVRFSNLVIRVVPKLVGDSLNVIRMIDYASSTDSIRPFQDPHADPDREDLFDLICRLTVAAADDLVRDGLLRDYRLVEDDLPLLRGRLLHREQFLRRFGQMNRFECRFDEFDGDNAENQLVAAALTRLSARARESKVRSAGRRLAHLFDEVCRPHTADADWYDRTITYDRRNSRYQRAHGLAKLVLRGLSIDDMFDTDAGIASAFMIDMNPLFEAFVTRLIEEALDGTALRPSAQERNGAVIRDEATGKTYSTIRPDLVIRTATGDRSVPVDVKYKRYDQKRLSTADIYQAFFYAFAFAGEQDRRGGIIYPVRHTKSGPALSIKRIDGAVAARIPGAGLDLPVTLDALSDKRRAALFTDVRRLVEGVTGLAADARSSIDSLAG